MQNHIKSHLTTEKSQIKISRQLVVNSGGLLESSGEGEGGRQREREEQRKEQRREQGQEQTKDHRTEHRKERESFSRGTDLSTCTLQGVPQAVLNALEWTRTSSPLEPWVQ